MRFESATARDGKRPPNRFATAPRGLSVAPWVIRRKPSLIVRGGVAVSEAQVYWQCGLCLGPYQARSRRPHAKGVHKVRTEGILWTCLERRRVYVCGMCHMPFSSKSDRDGHENRRNACKAPREVRDRETAPMSDWTATTTFWVDWSDPMKPRIRIWEEGTDAPQLTFLSAQQEIEDIAVKMLEHWHTTVAKVRAILPEELEDRG